MERCFECDAEWMDGRTCEDHFHQMLFWEAENPEYGEVHHLMVLSYYLQHPSLYSPEGLQEARRLLAEFLESGLTPQEARRRNRDKVASDQRTWKIKGEGEQRGAYPQAVVWKMRAEDVTAGEAEHYCANVRKWARLIHDTLREIGE